MERALAGGGFKLVACAEVDGEPVGTFEGLSGKRQFVGLRAIAVAPNLGEIGARAPEPAPTAPGSLRRAMRRLLFV